MIKPLALRSFFLPGTVYLVLGLGINCTIGYGTLFYAFSLLSLEFEETFGWRNEFIYGIYSLGVLLSGFISPLIGKALDKFGVRWPMTIGSLLIAISLLGLSAVQSQWQFVVSLLMMEAFSILVLYESAFVALTHAGGQQARLPITQITLIAGFASTIFWPFTHWLIDFGDWRFTYQVMAVMHLVICLPLHFYLLRRVKSPVINTKKEITVKKNITVRKKVTVKKGSVMASQHNYQQEILVALAFGIVAFCISGIQLHLFNIVEALNLPEKVVLIASVLIGPCQVFSRFTDMLMGKYITPLILACISILLILLGLILLLLAGLVTPEMIVLYAIFFGMGQGLAYIVRGAVPLYLFGKTNYGTITGRINGIRMVLTAIAPVSFAWVIQAMGVFSVLYLVIALLAISILMLHRVGIVNQRCLKSQAETQIEVADC